MELYSYTLLELWCTIFQYWYWNRYNTANILTLRFALIQSLTLWEVTALGWKDGLADVTSLLSDPPALRYWYAIPLPPQNKVSAHLPLQCKTFTLRTDVFSGRGWIPSAVGLWWYLVAYGSRPHEASECKQCVGGQQAGSIMCSLGPRQWNWTGTTLAPPLKLRKPWNDDNMEQNKPVIL